MTEADFLIQLTNDEDFHSRRQQCRFTAVGRVLRQLIQQGI